jgi:hypothetical protein
MDVKLLTVVVRGWEGDDLVDLAGDVSLEAADGFAAGFAFGDAAVEVVAGAGVPAQPGQGDAVERGVGLPVAAAIESATAGFARGRFQRADAAQGGKTSYSPPNPAARETPPEFGRSPAAPE